MILRIDHVSIAVKEYDKAFDFFTKIMGAVPGVGAEDGNMKYRWDIFSLGDLTRLEILTPTGEGSFLDGFLAKKDGGVHHLTIQVEDIYAARDMLDREKIPYFGFADYGPIWKEVYIHPRDAFGVLIQFAEFRPDDWLPPSAKLPEDEKFRVEKNGDNINLSVKNPGGGITRLELTKDEAESLSRALASK